MFFALILRKELKSIENRPLNVARPTEPRKYFCERVVLIIGSWWLSVSVEATCTTSTDTIAYSADNTVVDPNSAAQNLSDLGSVLSPNPV